MTPDVADAIKFPPETLTLLRVAARELPRPAYLVGGALRDALLVRATPDLDLAVRGARAAAARLARRLRASFVVLDDKNGTYRLCAAREKSAAWRIDVSELQGADITADLSRRDFTINALALPLEADLAAPPLTAIIDPRGGIADLRAGRLRCEDEAILKADPLRLLRAFRLAVQLGLTLEPATLRRIHRLRLRARLPAAERIGAELTLLLAEPGCSRWLKAMDAAGVLTALFEDLEAARQCASCYYGRGGVLRHTLEVAARLDLLFADPRRALGDTAIPLLKSLEDRLRPGHPWRATLMLAALLHDIAKPEKARRLGGRLRFFGHDTAGARRAAAILRSLRFPNEAVETVAAIVTHHLRPGNLAASGAVSDKAAYRFFRDMGDHAAATLLVCWADHASYLPVRQLERLLPLAHASPTACDLSGVRPVEARKTLRHLQVIAELLRRRFDERQPPVPQRLINGRDVMKILEIPPGPRVGAALEKIREAQAVGKVRTRKEALELLRRLPTPSQ